MATLFGTKIQDTYDGLLKVTDNIGITGTKKFITDGLGVNSSVKISSLDFEVVSTDIDSDLKRVFLRGTKVGQIYLNYLTLRLKLSLE